MVEISNKFTSKLLKGAGIGMVCVSFSNCNSGDSQKNFSKEKVKTSFKNTGDLSLFLIAKGIPKEVAQVVADNCFERLEFERDNFLGMTQRECITFLVYELSSEADRKINFIQHEVLPLKSKKDKDFTEDDVKKLEEGERVVVDWENCKKSINTLSRILSEILESKIVTENKCERLKELNVVELSKKAQEGDL